ncbi:MAG: hypothetical protein A2Z17_05980 [Gammaproteobacteria bacterium RBG_16_66_13]|nr:MAG: hypothetical protein A2Z17_05980 [Gammaproteobacteria bacterium RBG_16_66_13]
MMGIEDSAGVDVAPGVDGIRVAILVGVGNVVSVGTRIVEGRKGPRGTAEGGTMSVAAALGVEITCGGTAVVHEVATRTIASPRWKMNKERGRPCAATELELYPMVPPLHRPSPGSVPDPRRAAQNLGHPGRGFIAAPVARERR